MSEKRNMMTAEGKAKLQERLDHYLRVKRPEISERISQARDFGDISENSEYDEAKREQVDIETDIREMQEQLANAEIIDESSYSTDEVRLGSRIKVVDIELHEEMEFSIKGSSEADPFIGVISNVSPLGSALLQHKKGETVRVNTPDGIIKYKILEILPKDQA